MTKKKVPVPLRPWFAASTALLGGLAGLFGSVYSNQIAGSVPFIWLKDDPVLATSLFVLTLVMFGVCFGRGFKAQILAQNESASSLNESVAAAQLAFKEQLGKLEETVRTLPPDSFLVEFEDQFHAAFAVASDALACAEDQDLEQQLFDAISACLWAILMLAKAYDPPGRKATYSVNLMVNVPLPQDQAALEALRPTLQMFESTADIRTLSGYLELRHEFSLSTEDELRDGEEQALGAPPLPAEQPLDEEQPSPVRLPLPAEQYRDEGGRSTVLPGAPAAWCAPAELQYVPDVSEMVNGMSKLALRPVIQESAEAYFKEHPVGSTVKSFISLPFGLPGDQLSTYVQTFGVINVHSSEFGLLGQKESQMYGPLTLPLRALLCLLWRRWEEAGYK